MSCVFVFIWKSMFEWQMCTVFYAMWKLFQQTKLAFWRRKSVLLHLHSRYLADAVFQGNLQNCFSITNKTIVINRWHAFNLESYLLESKCFIPVWKDTEDKSQVIGLHGLDERKSLTTFMLGRVLQLSNLNYECSSGVMWEYLEVHNIIFVIRRERERGRRRWRAE